MDVGLCWRVAVGHQQTFGQAHGLQRTNFFSKQDGGTWRGRTLILFSLQVARPIFGPITFFLLLLLMLFLPARHGQHWHNNTKIHPKRTLQLSLPTP